MTRSLLLGAAWLALLAPGPVPAQPASGGGPGRAASASAPATALPDLTYRSLREGTGPKPTAADTVQVHYRGTLTNGTEFDSSYQRNAPASFPLTRVIRCWTEGVQRMKVGGKAQLTCPPHLAYGERGAGGVIPPNAVLVFEIELLAILPR
jgi:FKBP-type peptidyl-prolyl cis-trans isomerase FkpA